MKNSVIKRLCRVLLCVSLVLSMSACGGNSGSSGTENGAAAEENTAAEDDAAAEDNDASKDSGAANNGEVFEVDLSLSVPEPSAAGLIPVLDAIEEESGGRIKFNVYYSYSLVALADLVDGLQSGVVDMASIVPYEYSTLFPLNGQVFGMPFLNYPSQEGATEIYKSLVESMPELVEEYENQGLVYLTAYMMPPYQLHFKEKNSTVRLPSDLKGYKLICGSPEMQELITKNSGAPVFMPPTDYYSTLEKGVAEGIVGHLNVVSAFGCSPELTGTHVFFGESGAYMYLMGFVFSDSFWNSLPEDLQQIFLNHAEDISNGMLYNDIATLEANIATTEGAGNEIINLKDEEIAVWTEEMLPIAEASVQSLVDGGVAAAKEVYDAIKEAIASY